MLRPYTTSPPHHLTSWGRRREREKDNDSDREQIAIANSKPSDR
ncbi:MAG: hypothetical protein AB4290_16410 [Spirulina sp.]